MQGNRWIDTTQPQTLMIAVILLYMNAVFELLFGGGVRHPILLVLIVGQVLAGFGIANEKRWGYGLAIAVAVMPFVLLFFPLNNPFATDLISLLFEVALVALLLHPQSREYQRIWFK